MRREVPLLITAVVGLFMILSFFVPHPLVSGAAGSVKEWFIVISAFAVVLGVGNLIYVNLQRIRRREADWGYKVVTLVGLFVYATLGLVTDVELQIRPTWLTRGLGIVEPDRRQILDGRERLVDRRSEVARAIEGAPTPEAAADALVKEFSFDRQVLVPDLLALGAEGVRNLSPEGTFAELEAAWQAPSPTQRTLLSLEGRLQVTGIRSLVIGVLDAGRDDDDARRELMESFSLTWDQADDMIAMGPGGVGSFDAAEIAKGRADLEESEKGVDPDAIRNPSDWIFKYAYSPLQATMFSLLAFFIASAAFRAFRMRTLEAGLLLAAGLLVMFGRVPIGQFDWHIADSDFGFHTIMQWIMNVPTTAAMRGIKMGAAMGVIVMGLKVILGIERSYLGGD